MIIMTRKTDAHTETTILRRASLLLFAIVSGFKFALAAGTDSAAFLDIPVGAGPAALGSAYTARATDAYAPVWNAAGLGFVEGSEIAGQHVNYLESIHYEYLGGVHSLGKGRGLGTSIQYLGSGDMSGTDINGASIGSFSSHYAAYSLAYGQTLIDNLAVGLTGKWIDAAITGIHASAFAADLGGLYRPLPNLQVGAAVANVGTKMKFLQESESLPIQGRLGFVYQLNRQWDGSLEGVFRGSGPQGGHVGIQWKPVSMLSLRTGYRTDTTKQLGALAGFSTGLGLFWHGQEFSYAWLPYGDLGDAQYFSVVIRFGQKADETRNLIQYQTIHKHSLAFGDKNDVWNQGSTMTDEEIMQLLQQNEQSTSAPLVQGDAQ
jgi:hypothetical protein